MVQNTDVIPDEETLFSDIPSISCHAAMELENILNGSDNKTDSTEQLFNLFRDKLNFVYSDGVATAQSNLFSADPPTLIALDRVFLDPTIGPLVANSTSFSDKFKGIFTRLKSLIDDPASFRSKSAKDLSLLVSFSLILCDITSDFEQHLFDISNERPYRT